jgi:polar amino acid transport system permease protein
MTNGASRNNALRQVFWSIVLVMIVSLAVWAMFASVEYNWNWSALWKFRGLIMSGWLLTIFISAASLLLSIVLGFGLMIGQRSPWMPVRMFCRGYVELVRGTPLLVQLLVGYYIIANSLRINMPIPVGIFLLGSFEGAYLAEIFRGALESIGASQLEAARAVGFDRTQTYRFVILPQAVRRALPGTAGEMISLIKSSSLLSVIGIEEVTQTVKVFGANTFATMEGFIPLALLYLALTLPLSWWARGLENKFKYET